MSEAIEIRLHRARSWVRKAERAGENGDIDGQFIFLWIALNALYGSPRYRPEMVSDEIADLTRFLDAVEKLSQGEVARWMMRLEVDVAKILQNPFLNIQCWREWDKAGIRDRGKRIASSCNSYRKSHHIAPLFRQLYTLRNQILHGAATDKSRLSRGMLRSAIAILLVAVPAFVELVKLHHWKLPMLEALPYPPSLGEAGRFNVPRVKGIAHGAADVHARPEAFGR